MLVQVLQHTGSFARIRPARAKLRRPGIAERYIANPKRRGAVSKIANESTAEAETPDPYHAHDRPAKVLQWPQYKSVDAVALRATEKIHRHHASQWCGALTQNSVGDFSVRV